MGVVYLAVRADDSFRKRVAIKLVRRGMDSDAILHRFRNERQILATLEHPHIARLLDGGTTEDGVPYLVMEYVGGTPLLEYCEGNHLSIAERLRLFLEICSAVQYAHGALVVHRDLKPSNVLVNPDGKTKLLDFGIAKVLNAELFGDPAATSTALRVMTPEYASPEQIRGGHITVATDTYGLGLVLYELLTGCHPYRRGVGTSEDLLHAICDQEPEKPSAAVSRLRESAGLGDPLTSRPQSTAQTRNVLAKLRRDLSGDLDAIVLRAIRKEPQHRYASARELADDIGRYLDGHPVFARTGNFGYRASKFVKRNRSGLISLTVILVALAIFMGLLLRANKFAHENARLANSRLAASHEEQGRQLLLAGDPLRGIVYLDRAMQEGASGPALRYLIGRAKRALDAQVASLQHSDYVREAHFSPDGKRIVTASFDKTAKLWDAATAKLIATLKHETKVFSARFNLDGTRIVTAGDDGAVRIWNGSTGALIHSIDAGPASSVHFVGVLADFNPDGTLIATASGPGVKIWDAKTFELVAAFSQHSRPILNLAFHPDGQYLFTGAMDGTVKKWDTKGRLLFSVGAHLGEDPQWVTSLSVSKDGKRLATVNWGGIGQIRDAYTGDLISTLRSSDTFLYSITLSPDGKTVATAGDSRIAKVWNADTGDLIRTLEGHTSALRTVSYSADGQALLTASSDGTAKLWSAFDAVPRMSFVGHLDSISSAELSPDAIHVITASYDATAKLWDARNSFRLLTITDSHYIRSADWSSDGQRILTVNDSGEMQIRDAVRGDILSQTDTRMREVLYSAWSPDQTRLVAATYFTTKLLAFPSGNAIAELRGHSLRVLTARFSPDSQLLATGSADHTIRLWNARNGLAVRTLEGHSADVTAIAFQSDGKRMATGSDDKKVYIWDVSTGARVLEISDFKGGVRAAAFSPDGKRLATASRDKRLMIWNAEDGSPLIPIYEGKLSNINSVEFDPEGDLLYTSDVAGTVGVWDAHSGRALSADLHREGAITAKLRPDGQKGLSVSQRELAIWMVDSERRPPAPISDFVRCRVPFRLEFERLLERVVDRAACDH
jgi:WD40 repeat protein